MSYIIFNGTEKLGKHSLSVIIKSCGVDGFQKTICKRLKEALKNEQSCEKWANTRTKLRERVFLRPSALKSLQASAT